MFARISATVLFLALSTLAVASDYGEPDTELLAEVAQSFHQFKTPALDCDRVSLDRWRNGNPEHKGI